MKNKRKPFERKPFQKLKDARPSSRLPDGRHNPEYKRWYRVWKKYNAEEKEREKARILRVKRESPESYADRIVKEVDYIENTYNPEYYDY